MEDNIIKKLNRIIKIFVIAGISLGVLLLVVDKAKLIDLRGEFDYSYGSKREHCESLKNSDVVLPYKYYNLLSAKEGVLWECIRTMDDDSIWRMAFHPKYEYLDNQFIVLCDGIKEGYGITDGKGNWIIEPKYQEIRTDYYEKYGVLVFVDSSAPYEFSAVVDRDLNYIVSGYQNIYIWNGKIIVKNYDGDTHSDQYGLCDLNGNFILEPKCHKIETRKEDDFLYVTDENDVERLFDSEGNELLDGGYKRFQEFKCVNDNSENLFYIVQDNEGKWYICDENWSKHPECKYDGLTGEEGVAESGILIAEKDGKKGIINALNNEILLDIDYEDILPAGKEMFIVTTEGGKKGIYNLSEGFCVEPIYKEIQSFYGDKCIVKSMDREIRLYTREDGFVEADDFFANLEEFYRNGNYSYYPDIEVACYTYNDGKIHSVIHKNGKNTLEIECAENHIEIFEDYFKVSYGTAESTYIVDYDGK